MLQPIAAMPAAPLPALDPEQPSALLTAVALLASDKPALLAALLDESVSLVEYRLQAERAAVQHLLQADDGAAARKDLLRRWSLQDAQAASAAVAKALASCLRLGAVGQAAALACQHGTSALRHQVLRQAGWRMLFSAERPWLGQLLEACAADAGELDDDLRALQLAWRIEVQRLPHEAERALRAQPLIDSAMQALLESRCAQMYDAPACALQHALVACHALQGNLAPPALMAQYALGFALFESGRPAEALEPLSIALRSAARDGLVMLQFDVLCVLARVHDEMAAEAACRTCLQRALALAATIDGTTLPALDSLHRLNLLRSLRLWPDQASASETSRSALEQTDRFPHQILQTLQHACAGRLDAAQALVRDLQLRQSQAFYCYKWRNELSYVALWLEGQHQRGNALLDYAAGPISGNADSLYPLQCRVMQAAAALLAGASLPLAELASLAALLEARKLLRLHGRLALIQALHPAQRETNALQTWLADPSADIIDALWLALRLVAPLDRLLGTPALARDSQLLMRARALLQRILPARPDTANEAPITAPPQDLTSREWQVLQLIGQQLNNEQIAARLFLSIATVKTHINRLYGKLGITSRIEAVQRARALASSKS